MARASLFDPRLRANVHGLVCFQHGEVTRLALAQMGGGSFSLSFGETAALPTALAEPLAADRTAASFAAAVKAAAAGGPSAGPVVRAAPLAELPADRASWANARPGTPSERRVTVKQLSTAI